MIHKTFKRTAWLAVIALTTSLPANSQSDFGHFDPKGKQPSEHTLKVFEEARNSLPFADRRDYEEQERGLIAERKDLKIMADSGDVAWDLERYQFLNEPEKINSVHPSLLRLSQLNNNYAP